MNRKQSNHEETAEQKPPVYGNESFGIPSDYTKKQKFSGLKLAFYIVVVVSVCGLLYGAFHRAADTFLPEMTFDKSNDPLLYIRNKGLAIKRYSDRKGKDVSSSEQAYSSVDGRFVAMSDNEKYVFFAQDNTGTGTGFDLCYRIVSAANGEKEKPNDEIVRIDSDVRSYKIHPNGNFVLYQKGNRLYFSNLTERVIVAADVTEYYLSKNSQQMIYYKTDGRIYTRATTLKSLPVLVDYNISKVLSEKEEYAKMYYIKGTALYAKEHGGECRLIAEQVADAIMLGEYLYFVRKEDHAWRMQEIFSDDMLVSDDHLEKPALKDYYAEDLTGRLYLDETAYHNALAIYDQKLLRDTIRKHLTDHPITTEQFVLYRVERDGVSAIDKNLSEYTLCYNSCKDTVIYKRNILQEEKIRISTLTGIEDAITRATLFVEEPVFVGMGVLQKDRKPYVGLAQFPKGRLEISLDGKYLYCMEQIDESGTGTLVRYEFSAKQLKNREELVEHITDFALDGADSQVVIVFDGNAIGIVQDRAYTHLSDNSNRDFFYVDGTLFFFDGYDESTKTGTLKRYRDGKVRTVDTHVHAYNVRNLKTVAYIKNYNTEFEFGDLYVKTGNRKREKIDICVHSILH